MENPAEILLGNRPYQRDDNVDNKYLFNATLQPNISLRPRGFLILISAITVVGFLAGIVFIMVGAWPVMGFLGFDVVLIYFAFKANYRWARRSENILVTEDSLVVERISHRGKVQCWCFQPYWLRVELVSRGAHDSQLILSSHGKRLRIASFLSPDERVELADSLSSVLSGLRGYRSKAVDAAI
jgi:uncharacterized membrane protein